MSLRRLTFGAALAVAAEASIFWEKLGLYYDDMSIDNLQQVMAWQIAGLFLPLLAGPMKVVAYLFWNVDQAEAADYMKAYLYFYDIYYLENFWGYFMDYLVYGKIYDAIGWESTFTEIDFEPTDLLCYDLNGFDPDTSLVSPIPAYGDNTISLAASVTCTTAVNS